MKYSWFILNVDVLARSTHGFIYVGDNLGHEGVPISQTSSSNWETAATNQIQSYDLEECGESATVVILVLSVGQSFAISLKFILVHLTSMCINLLNLNLCYEITCF